MKIHNLFVFLFALLLAVSLACSNHYSVNPVTIPKKTACNIAGNVGTLAGGGCAGCTIAGYINAQGTSAEFWGPGGLAVDGAGNVYVGDVGNSMVRKIDPSGNVSTLAGGGCAGCTIAGYINAQGTSAEFFGPEGLAVDGAGNVYVSDTFNNLIRKIDPSGNVTTVAGGGCAGCTIAGYINGQGANAEFNWPGEIAVDSSGNVYVADGWNNVIRKIDPSGYVSTVAGGGCAGCTIAGYANGQGTSAEFDEPWGLVLDGSGNLYVADVLNNMIRKIDPSANVTTVAGGGAVGPLDISTHREPTRNFISLVVSL